MTGGRQTETSELSIDTPVERALRRILQEIHDGLRHGFFEYVVTCEVIGQERRRLILRAGKNHQFLIPKDECMRSTGPKRDSCDGSDTPCHLTKRDASST